MFCFLTIVFIKQGVTADHSALAVVAFIVLMMCQPAICCFDVVSMFLFCYCFLLFLIIVHQVLSSEVRWVITVPAIWRQQAKQFMREAAYQVVVMVVGMMIFITMVMMMREVAYQVVVMVMEMMLRW